MLKYNVWIFNFNQQEIEIYNVFRHYGFFKTIKKILLEYETIEDFSEQLKKEVMYHFWAKAEWEIIIQPWSGCCDIKKTAKKIDVYDQLTMNWEHFVKYIWDNKQEVINYE